MIFGPDLNILADGALVAIPFAFVACALVLWALGRWLCLPAVTFWRSLLVTLVQWLVVIGAAAANEGLRRVMPGHDLMNAITVSAALTIALSGPVIVVWRLLPCRLALAAGLVLLQQTAGLAALAASTVAAMKFLTREWTSVG